MKLAHKMAKTFVGDYVACLALAMKILHRESDTMVYKIVVNKQVLIILKEENGKYTIQFESQVKEITQETFLNIEKKIRKQELFAKYGIYSYQQDYFLSKLGFKVPAGFKKFDPKNIEKKEIDELFRAGEYEVFDKKEASKELDDASHKPIILIVSRQTKDEFNISNRVEVEKTQTSRRVAVYSLSNIPVLTSNKFYTVVIGWWNRPCRDIFEKGDVNER